MGDVRADTRLPGCLPKVRVAPGSDTVTELLQGARRPVGARQIVAQRVSQRCSQLVQAAAEELPARLELGSEPEEAEAVVARHVQAAAELVEEEVERGAARLREPG